LYLHETCERERRCRDRRPAEGGPSLNPSVGSARATPWRAAPPGRHDGPPEIRLGAGAPVSAPNNSLFGSPRGHEGQGVVGQHKEGAEFEFDSSTQELSALVEHDYLITWRALETSKGAALMKLRDVTRTYRGAVTHVWPPQLLVQIGSMIVQPGEGVLKNVKRF